MRTLFIGDLHLSADRPDITQAFTQFLDNLPNDTQALYILGDLFEVWVGDDLAEPFAIAIANKIAQISKHLPIYFVHGNRDFMLGKSFASLAGMKILNEHTVTEIYGKKVVILHGDSLCTEDKAYQRFRRFRNINLFRYLYLLLPKAKRLNIAQKLRNKSKSQNQYKASNIMDVEQASVEQELAKNDATLLIHGHTHKPAIHQLKNSKQRLVVGDWYSQGSVLTLTENEVKLTTLDFKILPESLKN